MKFKIQKSFIFFQKIVHLNQNTIYMSQIFNLVHFKI